MKNNLLAVLLVALMLSGCAGAAEKLNTQPGMGMGSGMSSRHHAVIPEEYAGLSSPILEETDIEKGGELYTKLCASCHGEGGMGDGLSAAALDPAPAPVAHTSTMLSDAYLYWRTADGGAEFKTTMPAWKGTLSEDDIWAVIGYMRALGSGDYEAVYHEQMLAQAVEQNLISEDESATFTLVHDALDEFRILHADELPEESMDENQDYMLGELVNAGTITQAQADDFARIHQLLLDEGLMH